MKIARVCLAQEGSTPLCATKHFLYEETHNGIVVSHGASRRLIPWHRIYEIEYERAPSPLDDSHSLHY